jgi:nucleotide-binding universal stress UspA family protein
MFCPRRILVPVDFGCSAMPAAACAYDLARTFGSHVHLLHVSPEPAAQSWARLVSNADLEHQAEEWRADAMAELEAFAALTTRPGGPHPGRPGPTLAVRVSDDAPAAILAYARDTGCDLIVMGTHRPSTLGLLLGSTGDWVRRHAACPVILVPPATDAPAIEAWEPGRVERRMAAAS